MSVKWIFAALVLANVGLWMWANWYKAAPEEEIRHAQEPIAPEKMRLLNEAGAKLMPRKTAVPADAVPTDTTAVCFDLGPFADGAAVTAAEGQLGKLPVKVSRRSEETRSVTGYQVFLPPLASKEIAERKRQELSQMGFRDHALIQEGALENAISLGLFSVEANAEARVRELAAKQIKAQIQPFQHSRARYWLDIRTSAESAATIKLLEWKTPEITLRETACRPNDTKPRPDGEPAPTSPPG